MHYCYGVLALGQIFRKLGHMTKAWSFDMFQLVKLDNFSLLLGNWLIHVMCLFIMSFW